jgi:hypothetical protein
MRSVCQRHLHSHVYQSTVFSSKKLETAKNLLTNEWVNKMWHTYIMEYYSGTKKNEMLSFATSWIELEIMMLKVE